MKVTFLGLGVMGFPMAGHLAEQGFEVTVFNRTPSKMESWLKKYHGRSCSDLLKSIERADVVCACLGGDNDLQSVLIDSHLIDKMPQGSLLIDHTTASPEMAKKLGHQCREKKVGFLDAPISGGEIGAEKGILSIMAGGDPADFKRAQPILQSYGKNIVLIGQVGTGQTAKVINQICVAHTIQGLAEGLALGMRSDLDLEKVLNVISKGAAQSWQMEQRGPTMLKGEYNFGFAVKWMIKDLKIALSEGKKVNADLNLTQQILDRYYKILENGGENFDTSSLLTLTRPS